MNNIVTIPNLISLLRLFGGIAFIPLNNYYRFSDLAILIIIVGAWFTDILDGYVARKMNQISDSGKFIDPVADKIFVFALVINFYISGRVELGYLVIVILRDLLIMAGGLAVKNKTGIVLPSNLLGKICVFSIGIYFLSILSGSVLITEILKWISLVLIFGSLFVYFQRAYELIKDLNYVYKEN